MLIFDEALQVRVSAAACVLASLTGNRALLLASPRGLLILGRVGVDLARLAGGLAVGPMFVLLVARQALVVAAAGVLAARSCVRAPCEDTAVPRRLLILRRVRVDLAWRARRLAVRPMLVLGIASQVRVLAAPARKAALPGHRTRGDHGVVFEMCAIRSLLSQLVRGVGTACLVALLSQGLGQTAVEIDCGVAAGA